jgi:hypothetical protein
MISTLLTHAVFVEPVARIAGRVQKAGASPSHSLALQALVSRVNADIGLRAIKDDSTIQSSRAEVT